MIPNYKIGQRFEFDMHGTPVEGIVKSIGSDHYHVSVPDFDGPVLLKVRFVGVCDEDGMACDEAVATHALYNVPGPRNFQTVMRRLP